MEKNENKRLIKVETELVNSNNAVYDLVSSAIASRNDLNAKNEEGNTLLHTVVWAGVGVIVSLEKDDEFDTSRHIATVRVPLVKYFQRLIKDDIPYQGIRRLLVEKLVKAGADVNAQDKYGQTLLHIASGFNNNEIVTMLIKAKADVNAKESLGYTSLHIAAIYDTNGKILRSLIEAGAEIEAEDNDGYTPMDKALINNNSVAVHVLIEEGANINDKQKFRSSVVIPSDETPPVRIGKVVYGQWKKGGAILDTKDYNRY